MVACEDVVALAAAICEVLENPERARRWNVNLQERVRESFTWSRALQQYLRLSPAVHPEGLGAGAKDVL
jgi:glycosyltransferase involved in cell wall biosynthesis